MLNNVYSWVGLGRTPISDVENGLLHTATSGSISSADAANVSKDKKLSIPRPRHTAEELKKMSERYFAKDSRGPMAAVAMHGTVDNVLIPMVEAVVAGALTRQIAKPAFSFIGFEDVSAAVNVTTALAMGAGLILDPKERQIAKLVVRGIYKPLNKGFSLMLKGIPRPSLSHRANMMATTMRQESKEVEKHLPDKTKDSLEILDALIDDYLNGKKLDSVEKFIGFFHLIKTRELMVRAPLPFEVKELTFEKFQEIRKKILAATPKEIHGGLSVLMTKWGKKKCFSAIAGDSYLPKCDKNISEFMCENFDEDAEPVVIQMSDMVEAIDVQLSKEAKSRIKTKTLEPVTLLGPFMKWIESKNSACPIVIKGFDPANADHVRVLSTLKQPECTEIPIHCGSKGVVFHKNIECTPFILDMPELDTDAGSLEGIEIIKVGKPSTERREEALDTAVKKYMVALDIELENDKGFKKIFTQDKKDYINNLMLAQKPLDSVEQERQITTSLLDFVQDATPENTEKEKAQEDDNLSLRDLAIKEGENLSLTKFMEIIVEILGELTQNEINAEPQLIEIEPEPEPIDADTVPQNQNEVTAEVLLIDVDTVVQVTPESVTANPVPAAEEVAQPVVENQASNQEILALIEGNQAPTIEASEPVVEAPVPDTPDPKFDVAKKLIQDRFNAHATKYEIPEGDKKKDKKGKVAKEEKEEGPIVTITNIDNDLLSQLVAGKKINWVIPDVANLPKEKT